MENRKVNSLLNDAILSVADGRVDEVSVVYDLLGKQIYYMAYSVLRCRADSEDILQDTLLQVMTNAGDYKKGTNPVNWLLTIAKNKALNKLNEYSGKVPLEEITYSERYAQSEESLISPLRLSEALMTLDETDRMIVSMKVQMGYSLREISKFLSLPLTTVEKRFQRAKLRLNAYFINAATKYSLSVKADFVSYFVVKPCIPYRKAAVFRLVCRKISSLQLFASYDRLSL